LSSNFTPARTQPCTRTIQLRKPLAAFVLAALAAQHAEAQSKVEPVIVTASRNMEALADTLRDVTVIRGDDLAAAGANDLAATLQAVAGLEVQTLGAGATPSIFIRGGNSNQLLVLVDGQRVGSSFSGLSALQHIPISLIDRIEIVRGATASLYGADAMSGAVQIFTKRGKGLSASAMIGEQQSSDISARAGFASGGNTLSIAANHRESRGFNAIVDPNNFSFNPDRDGYRFSSAQVVGSVAIAPTLMLEANALVAKGNAQYDGSSDFDDRIESSLRNLSAQAVAQLSPRWQSTLALGQGVDVSQFISSFPGRYRTAQDQANWQNNLKLDGSTRLWSALEWRREKIASSEAFAVESRRTVSAVLGGETSLAALKLAGSLRIDDSNQYGRRTTGHLGLAYTLAREWRVLANAGTSFKAPTFNDLYFPGFSNPALEPERGESVEAAIEWSRGAASAKLVAYSNRVRDLIQFQCDESFNCAPQNVAKADLRGATLSAAARLAGWRIEASLDVADPIDAKSGLRLARRAKLHGALKVSGDVFGLTSSIELIASGDRFDNPANTRRLGGYGIVNLFARREVMRGVALGLRLDNAFDNAYQNSFGYANGGRRAWITLSANQL
jgi:vitamin B12 transporter